MRNTFCTLLVSLLVSAVLSLLPRVALAQTNADSIAIEKTALDYIQGYYSGNPERMERALHPELAKRIVRTDENGLSNLEQMDASTLVGIARMMAQRPVPEDRWVDEVRILDVFEGVASVRIDAAQWVDYLHLARWNGEWKIVNVLWEMRPGG